MKIFTTLMVAAAFLASATMASAELKIEKAPFGEVEGQPVDLYTLTNANGLVMTVTNYGGIVVSLTVPDKAGNLGDIVLGFSTVADYVKNSPYYGITAALSDVTATGSAKRSFRWTAKNMRWPRIMAKTACTAASKDSTK